MQDLAGQSLVPTVWALKPRRQSRLEPAQPPCSAGTARLPFPAGLSTTSTGKQTSPA